MYLIIHFRNLERIDPALTNKQAEDLLGQEMERYGLLRFAVIAL